MVDPARGRGIVKPFFRGSAPFFDEPLVGVVLESATLLLDRTTLKNKNVYFYCDQFWLCFIGSLYSFWTRKFLLEIKSIAFLIYFF